MITHQKAMACNLQLNDNDDERAENVSKASLWLGR